MLTEKSEQFCLTVCCAAQVQRQSSKEAMWLVGQLTKYKDFEKVRPTVHLKSVKDHPKSRWV
jgi:hypothetical protein